MDLPLISIVTPSYNQVAFIEETICSVLSQDYPRLEYLVIDGGSTDGSVDVIRKYANRIAYWVSERDDGQADAINKGFKRAKGDIIAFLNSDDCYLPGAVSTIVELFRANPQAGVAFGRAQWVTAAGKLIRASRIRSGSNFVIEDIFSDGLPQPATFVRRSIAERVGYLDASFHLALDGEFFSRAIGISPAVSCDKVLATMRVHGDAKSVATGTRFAPEVLRMAEKIIANAAAYPRYDIEPNRLRASAQISAARFLSVGGQYRSAIQHLWTGARLTSLYRRQIVSRELPRVAARALLGRDAYERAGALTSKWHRTHQTADH